MFSYSRCDTSIKSGILSFTLQEGQVAFAKIKSFRNWSVSEFGSEDLNLNKFLKSLREEHKLSKICHGIGMARKENKYAYGFGLFSFFFLSINNFVKLNVSIVTCKLIIASGIKIFVTLDNKIFKLSSH